MINRDVEPEVGEMDPRLAEALNAFGSSRYDECRNMAAALIEASDDSSTRAECVGLIILSYLHQGDFAAARQAADRLRSISPDVCQDLLQQVNREERDYNAEVARWQQIVATTTNPKEAAQAQLRTARVHHIFGRLELAEQSYRKLADDHPQAAEASTALVQIAAIQYQLGRTQDALKTYWEVIWVSPESPRASGAVRTMERLAWRAATPDYARQLGKAVVDRAPDSELANAACEQLFELTSAGRKDAYGETRAMFEEIAGARPGTRAADAARFGIGQLYAAEGLSEQAEEEWAALVAERPSSRITTDARVSLAGLRYEMGVRAFLDRDHAQAVRWLEPLLPDLDLIRHSTASGRLPNDAHPTVASKRRLAVFSLGEAYQTIGKWDKAADIFARLAVPGNPAEEFALFELGRSKMETGYHADALEAFTKLKDRFPQSAYIAQCEGHIRTIQGER